MSATPRSTDPIKRVTASMAIVIATALLLTTPAGQAADGARNPEELFQRALFAEEGRRDLTNAIRDYEEVIRALDEQRRLAATALYRLGECYRKLGRPKEAAAQFERVLREYSSEDSLATLAAQNLSVVTGSTPVPTRDTPGAVSAEPAPNEYSRLSAQLAAIERLSPEPERLAQAVQAAFPDDGLKAMLLQLTKLRRQLTAVTQDPEARLNPVHYAINDDGVRRQDLLALAAEKMDAARATQQVQLQLASIKDRVDFILGIQRTRLLTAAGRDADAPARTQLQQEAALLASQLEQITALVSQERQAAAAESFWANTGLAQLRRQLANQEVRLSELRSSFADEHPDVKAQVAGLTTLKNRFRQEVADVIGAQETKLVTLREAIQRLNPAGATQVETNSTRAQSSSAVPATSKEAEEIRRIQSLVANSPDLINALSPNGESLLQTAAAAGQLAVARYLLDHGAKVNLAGKFTFQFRPLHAAVQAGHKSMVELFLQRGAEVQALDGRGLTPLHLAASMGFRAIAEVLIEAKADVNALRNGPRDRSAGCPLAYAVQNGRLEVAQLLLDHGADPNLLSDEYRPPLAFASGLEPVRLLLERGAEPNADGGLRLAIAVANRETDVVRLLLEKGAHPDAEPLALQKGFHSPLLAAVKNSDRSTAELLCSKGASINQFGSDGLAPIHLITGSTDYDLDWLAWALKQNADPNLRDQAGGRTPLESIPPGEARAKPLAKDSPDARKLRQLRWEKTELLLRQGADPGLTFSDGFTLAHHWAATAGPDELALLVALKADLNPLGGPTRATPLMVAVSNENLAAVEFLLRSGANPNLTDIDQNTSLHLAAAVLSLPAAKALVEAKADCTLRNALGFTPMEIPGPVRSHNASLRLDKSQLGVFRLFRGDLVGTPRVFRNGDINAADFAALVQSLTP